MSRLGSLALSAGFALAMFTGPSARSNDYLNFGVGDTVEVGHAESCVTCEGCGLSDCCCGGPSWRLGFDFVFAKPHFERNLAYTAVSSDGGSLVAIEDTEFNYDFDMTPRIWTHYESAAGVGIRGIYWHFDHTPESLEVQPPPNGFGLITHPSFGNANIPLATDVIIATGVPGDTFATTSGLDAYTLDLEVTKRGTFRNWELLVGGGVRYARIEQQYQALLSDGAGTAIGAIDYAHNIEGFGPTLSLETRRALSSGLTAFALGRGTLLMGEAKSQLLAAEDLDLVTPIFTRQTSARDDVLPIAELAIGSEWRSGELGFGELLVRGAFESQWWGGVGSASSENGDLGFLGFTAGIGLMR